MPDTMLSPLHTFSLLRTHYVFYHIHNIFLNLPIAGVESHILLTPITVLTSFHLRKFLQKDCFIV